MKVSQLIELLKTFPPDAGVAYWCCSEQCEMNLDEITLKNACAPRPDGWIQNERPDMPAQSYVLFPGN